MSYKKFTKDIGIMTLTQIIGGLNGLITLPIITKLLGAENYGIWTQLMVTIGIIYPVACLNLSYGLVRFLSGEKDIKKIQDGIWSVSSVIFGTSSIISIFLIIFSGPISNFFGCPSIFIKILAGIMIVHFLNDVFYSVLRTFRQNAMFCFFQILQDFAETGAIILSILYFKQGLFGILIAILIVRTLIFIIMGIYILKKYGFKIPQFLRTREYLNFTVPTVADSIFGWIIQSSDRYLIGFFLGAAFVGYYSSAYTIGLFIVNFLVSPFSFLLPAVLFKLHDENKPDEVKKYLKYSLKYFLLLAIPAVFGLSILSKQILTILTTAKFAEAGYIIMPIIALGMIPMGICAIIGQIMAIFKKTKTGALFSIIIAFLNLGLNLIFIPLFGILGAAITTLIAFTFSLLVTWVYSFKYLKFEFDINWQFIIKSLIASALMTIFVFWINPAGLYKTLTAAILGALIYVILIFLSRGFSEQEFQFFKKVIKNT